MNELVMIAALSGGFVAIPVYIPYPTSEKLIAVSAGQLVLSVVLGYLVPNDPEVTLWVSIAILIIHGSWVGASVIAYCVEKHQTRSLARKYILE